MAEDTWEIDGNSLTLDEYIVLSQNPAVDPAESKRVLGKLVTNKTAEELGRDYTWKEINSRIRSAIRAVDESAVPKLTDTP
ncbi:MAG TPA: hypothetical protein VMW79_10930 [Anaerolineae bacterium]|nr:hypothetical protein [Anaerolineae bacterium]